MENIGLTNGFRTEAGIFSPILLSEVQQRGEVFSEWRRSKAFRMGYRHRSYKWGKWRSRTDDAQLVSGNYFQCWAWPPASGALSRTRMIRVRVASGGVVSHAWWMRRLGGDPTAVGKTSTMPERLHNQSASPLKSFWHDGGPVAGHLGAASD